MRRLALCLFLSLPFVAFAQPAKRAQVTAPSVQPYQAKDFSHLLGMPGFSDETLKMHFTLYQGYVKNTNLLLRILSQYAQENKMSTPQFADIKRRLGWEFDGMRLHEYYFSNLGGQDTKLDPKSPLYKRIVKDFGSFDKWKSEFISTGLMRGIGWVILYEDRTNNRLMTMWIAEHDVGHMAGGEPILVLDVWEHAYLLQYGLDRKKYIEAFWKNIDWDVVSKRYEVGKISIQ